VPDVRSFTLAEVTMREMTVYGVSFDLVGKQPIVLLKTADGDKVLPVWIGHPEAASILMKLQGQEPPRPQTHDLLADVIGQLDAEVVRVTVTELRESTFHASITLRRNGDEIDVDSRTSDAIALALRAGAKIYAADDVIEESGVVFEGDAAEIESGLPATSLADLDPDEFRAFLDTVSAEEFAKTLEEDAEAESDDEEDEDDDEEDEDGEEEDDES
jgi:bifunctional DNase/RNase